MTVFQCRLLRWYPGVTAGYLWRRPAARPGSHLRLTLAIADGIVLPGPCQLQRVGRQAHEHFSRERVVRGMQLADIQGQIERAGASGEPGQEEMDHLLAILIRRSLLIRSGYAWTARRSTPIPPAT